ncbi:MAG TPA: hypothetical protein PKO09_08560 [Anaerolineae bacterium]|nr:hypothetical protein [Anaerolineae bacterium]
MKKRTLLLAVVVMLLLAAPALAREHEPTGDRLNIHCGYEPADCSGTLTYAATTAFYVSHGWSYWPPRWVPGQARFELEVDGVFIPPTYVEFTRIPGEPEYFLDRIYFFNFPEGMTGTHTFEGHWIIPCVFVDPECKPPMTDFDWVHSTFEITFY